MSGRIDAHQHFWRVDRGDYGWLTPNTGPIYRDFGPADLAPLLARNGIAETILVQAAPTVAETEYLLAIARGTPFVAGVVGWVDFEAPDAAAQIARLAADPLLVGLRPMVQDIADDDWLLGPKLDAAFQALVAQGLVFDALVLPRHLSRLARRLDRHPDLSVVLDHGAKPEIRDRRMAPWDADIAALAARKNIVCKISGLVTEAAADWRAEDLAPYVDHLIACFGGDRVMFGSDWPVATLASDYDRWVATAERLTTSLTAAEREAFWGGTARRIYLGERGRKGER